MPEQSRSQGLLKRKTLGTLLMPVVKSPVAKTINGYYHRQMQDKPN